jgi:hypothetical protein
MCAKTRTVAMQKYAKKVAKAQITGHKRPERTRIMGIKQHQTGVAMNGKLEVEMMESSKKAWKKWAVAIAIGFTTQVVTQP